MQVSKLDELDSHAVIGGGQVKSFFISDSPEFFQLLSSTLYRDKKLAVIREVLCNAHDAHIMGDCLATPIEVTLTDEELSIKDFGPGIPHEKMHQTYCGYGVSTKVQQANQTGGFGLGCKAPFAYSDHFTVVNCSEGKRTIYAISRGGIDSDGKPGLHPMVTVPSQEHGITVSVPMKDSADRAEFARLIKQVARNGGMLVKLNGELLQCHDFSGIEKTGYGLLFDTALAESAVYVRLGAVLYPVSTDNPDITQLVRRFNNGAGMRLIVQAKPGSIGVIPSREALSYTEEATAMLNEKLEQIYKQIQAQKFRVLNIFANGHVKPLKDPVVPTSFPGSVYPVSMNFTADPLEVACNIYQTAIQRHGELITFKFDNAQISKAILKAATRNFRDYRRVFRRAAYTKSQKALRERHCPSYREWLGESGHSMLRIISRLGIIKHAGRFDYERGNRRIVELKKKADAYTRRPTIVLARSKQQALDHVYSKSSNTINGMVVIVVRTMKPEKIQEIKTAFTKAGFEILELDLSVPAPKPKKVKSEPVQESYYTLDAVQNESWEASLNHKAEKVSHAPVFIDAKTLNDNHLRPSVREFLKLKLKIQKIYPNVALAIGAAQKRALIKAGSVEIKEQFAKDYTAIPINDETSFIYRAAVGGLFSGQGLYRPEGLGNFLSGSDLRFAKILAGRDPKVLVDEERQYRLFDLFQSTMYPDGELQDKLSKHYYALRNAAEKVKLNLPPVDYLKPLCSLTGRYGREEAIRWSEELQELLMFLRKQQSKQKPVQLKEAA